jgi:hypothetical protein
MNKKFGDFVKNGSFEVEMKKISLQKQLWQPKLQTFL